MTLDLPAWLSTHITPHAAALDTDPDALGRALDAAAEAGVLGFKAPVEAGGSDLDQPTRFDAAVEIAAASGTFAFLQTQHQGAVGFLSLGWGPVLRWMPELATGRVRCGIAYAYLRRPGPPLVTATPAGSGLHIRGHAPWMTGWGFFSHCVTAGVQPSGDISFVLHPLEHPGVEASAPMSLVAFEAARTVSLDLDVVVPEEDVLFTIPAELLHQQDAAAAGRQAAFPLGTATAAAHLVQDAVAAGRAPDDGTADRLLAEVPAIRDAALDPSDPPGARAAAVTLAGRAAHAAVSAWAGAANVVGHPAGRVWREVLGFTVLGQSASIQAATLGALARSAPGGHS